MICRDCIYSELYAIDEATWRCLLRGCDYPQEQECVGWFKVDGEWVRL